MNDVEELQNEWLRKNKFKIASLIGGTILSIIALRTVSKFIDSVAYSRHGRPNRLLENTIALSFDEILKLAGVAAPKSNAFSLEDILELKESASSNAEAITTNFQDLFDQLEDVLDKINAQSSE